MLSETKPNTKPVTEEAQAFSITTSGTDLNKFTAEDSSPLKKEVNIFCVFVYVFLWFKNAKDLNINNIVNW